MTKKYISYGAGEPWVQDREEPFNTVNYHESLGNPSVQFRAEDYKRVCNLLYGQLKDHEISRQGSVFTNWRVSFLISGGIIENITSSTKDCGEFVIRHEEIKGLRKLLDRLELPYRKQDFAPSSAKCTDPIIAVAEMSGNRIRKYGRHTSRAFNTL